VFNVPHFEVAQLFEVARQRSGRPMYGQWDHRLEGITLNQTIVTAEDGASAVSELRIATINATRTVFEPEAFAELQGLYLSSETDESDGILDWSGHVAWDAIIFPSWHADAGDVPLQLLNIDAYALRDMNLASSANERQVAANRLLETGPVLRIGPASQQMAAGGMVLDVAVLMHPGPVSPEISPAELVQRVEGRFDLSLPSEFIYSMVRDHYEDEAAHEAATRNLSPTVFQISRLAEARFDADLERIVTRGLLQRDGERLLVDLTLIDGIIQSAAQSEPVLDLIEWLGLLLRTDDTEVDT
jgi:Bacterial protein of unknown function (DUF945)